jgi:hypothetical protein
VGLRTAVGVGSGEPAACGGRGRLWTMSHAALAASASSKSNPNPLRNIRIVRFMAPPPFLQQRLSGLLPDP